MEIRPILSSMLRAKTAPLLIAAQVALTLAILCNALYIVRDRLETANRPTGADEASLSTIFLVPHRTIKDAKDLQRRDLEALKAIPGVISAAWTNQVPLGQSGWNIGGLTAETGAGAEQETSINAAFYFSADSLVETFDLRLIEGRDFTDEEKVYVDPQVERVSPRQMIISRALAQRLFPDRSSYVGQRFFLGDRNDGDPPVEVVGVIEKLQSPSAPASSQAELSMIAPISNIDGLAQYAIRSEPGQRERVMAAAEKALLALSHDRVLLHNRSLAQVRENRYAGETMMAGLLLGVTGFLLLITASGIVGMASLWVTQRRKQIGVRRALGARRADIIRYFLVENAMITTGGAIAGMALALALNDLLVRQLELPRLPLAYLGLGVLVAWLLGLLAVLGPALRAASVSPATATRTA